MSSLRPRSMPTGDRTIEGFASLRICAGAFYYRLKVKTNRTPVAPGALRLFEELPGRRTRMTGQSVFQTVEDRDGMVQAGMESGTVDSYERLDELLEKLQE